MPSDWDVERRIDIPEKTEWLLARLEEHLPFTASVRPALAEVIRKKLPRFDASRQYEVAKVNYLGDAGGIMCCLEIPELGKEVFVASITHLSVGPRMPLAREIAAYQKHRIKRMRRMDGLAEPKTVEMTL